MITELPIGLLKVGTIKNIDIATNTADVEVASNSDATNKIEIVHNVDITYPFSSNNGNFIGSLPPIGTQVYVLEQSWNYHKIISYAPTDTYNVPVLELGTVLLQANDETKISLKNDNHIFIGKEDFFEPGTLSIDTKNKTLNSNFDRNIAFTQGSRNIEGVVKRKKPGPSSPIIGNARLYLDQYENTLSPIGLDPSFDIISQIKNQNKNPPLIESRKITYEFAYDFNIKNLNEESNLYKESISNADKKNQNLYNRRKDRSDTLSLTLNDPNYLMESVQGTVVDIYGNILDINRYPLRVGLDSNLTLKSDNNSGKTDKSQTYLDIRAEQRKSIAYHFELNARKSNDAIISPPGINNQTLAGKDNYGRDRSRFFIDVDKEGQFKINIPASSETGNVSLLTRYENYTTLKEDSLENPDRIDVYLESFAAGYSTQNPQFQSDKGKYGEYNRGVISVKRDGVENTPIDRFFLLKEKTEKTKPYHIKHGTAYHDITATCLTHQIVTFADYAILQIPDVYSKYSDFELNPIKFNIVSTEIETAGKNANAGGRSGVINLDGSIELNIGANTVDRQSIWLDTAGGMIANFGRDKNYISAAINMDGYLMLQVGGYGIDNDTRFKAPIASNINNGFIPGVLDIRVQTDENVAIILRIDKKGLHVKSPSGITFESNNDMLFQSSGGIYLDAERIIINEREFYKAGPVYPSA